MGETTKIGWTDHTFNGWIGCTEVSAECDNCYARTLAKQYGWAEWGAGKPRHRTSVDNWKKPLTWNRKAAAAGVRRRVFSNSLSDVFDAEVANEWRRDLMDLIQVTPALDWLVLTKRPKVMADFFAERPVPDNLWAGTTIGDQKMADLRVPLLLKVPAKVRFLSVEPMLGPVALTPASLLGLDWIICGGESGAIHRPLQVEWARKLRDDCATAGVYFFFKQWGGRTPDAGGKILDGREHCEFPATASPPAGPA